MTSTLTGTGADATARAFLTAREGLAAAQREALEPRPFFDAPGLPSRTGCTIGVDVGGTKIALGMFDNERVPRGQGPGPRGVLRRHHRRLSRTHARQRCRGE